jgi:hypothetical protein
VASNDWAPFKGDYEKQFYEIRKGHAIIQHCWPNAGRLWPDGWAISFGERDGVEFRKCNCGHKYGGCLKPAVSP